MENQTSKKVKCLRIDNGLEFFSREFNEFCKEEGIARQYIIRNTPKQNKLAERMKRTLLERAKCILSNLGLNICFWAKATNTTSYLVNCSMPIAMDFKTPIGIWSNKPTNYTQF